MKLILYMMASVILAYSALDVYQTWLLFQFGAVEGNPILVWLIKTTGLPDITAIIVFKSVFLAALFGLIYIYKPKTTGE